MINRTLVRTKVVQTLFAVYGDSEYSALSARKTLLNKFSSTYSLYMMLLRFSDALTRYAEAQIREQERRAQVLHQSYVANRKFVNNRIAQQLYNNRRIRHYIDNEKLSWDAGMSAIELIYKQLLESDFYKSFMQLDSPSYDDEKLLWKKIYGTLLMGNEGLSSSLEEMELALDQEGWTTDMDVVLTYVVKTLKRMREDMVDELPLLEMFSSEEELNFAKDLLQWSLDQLEENKHLIAGALDNWEWERVAYMDLIILLVALAEIRQIHDIALEISLNEYIEIAKEYSSDKSYVFINGVLNRIVKDLRAENRLLKFASR